MNNVVLIGNMATSVEVRSTQTGKIVCDFRLAVNKYGNRDEADFFTIKMWDKNAETAQQMLHKGRKVAVSGRLVTESWISADGTNRSRIVVVAQNYEVIGPRKDQDADVQDEVIDLDRELAVL